MTARAIFVAGAGTGIGKTYIAAQLLRGLRARGANASALKPVMSGFDPGALGVSDAGILLDAIGRQPTLENVAAVAPFRFAPELPPTIAAARENRVVALADIVEACQQALDATRQFLIIEGAGGVMAPIAANATVLDLITALDVPALLIGGSYLGAGSHILTALAALDACSVPIVGIVVSESEESSVSLTETAHLITPFAGGRKLVCVKRNADASAELSALVLGLHG